MTLTIKDEKTEALVREIAALTGESETAAVREAARQRLDRMKVGPKHGFQSVEEVEEWLETEIWPLIPRDQLGKPISKAEREEILGYGPDGV